MNEGLVLFGHTVLGTLKDVLPIIAILLVFQLVVFGTQLCSYREIYGLETDANGSVVGSGNDHQFLA